jgi:signal peptidase I
MSSWQLLYVILSAAGITAALAFALGRTYGYVFVPILAILSGWTVFILGSTLPLVFYPLLYTAGAGVLVLLFFAVGRGWEGSRWSTLGFRLGAAPTRTLVVSGACVGLYVFFTLEPGLVFGASLVPSPLVAWFAAYVLAGPILVLGQEAVFRGYLLTKLSERISMTRAVFVSAGLFALGSFDPFTFFSLSLTGLGETLFLSVVTTFLLGVVASLYFYRGDWSLLGPWSLRTGILWLGALLPWTVTAPWPAIFIFQMMALGAILAILYGLIPEPRYRARHYFGEPLNPHRRRLLAEVRSRREATRTGLGVTVAVVALLLLAPPLVESPSAPVRFEAIATGSMVPTLPIGTLVVITPVASASAVHVGDIVAYNAPYLSTVGPVVHRVVAIHENGSTLEFTFKGDHNQRPDPRPVVFSQIVGRVIGEVPVLGYFVLAPVLTASVVAGIVLLAAFWSTPAGGRRRRRRPLLPLTPDHEP